MMGIMRKYLDISTTATRFRLISVIEAFTWAGLLLGMFFKYFTGERVPELDNYPNEIGVKIFGSLHGAAFILFLVLAFLAARAFKWSPKVMVAALAAAVIPFATIPFERWLVRNGMLGELSTQRPDEATLAGSK